MGEWLECLVIDFDLKLDGVDFLFNILNFLKVLIICYCLKYKLLNNYMYNVFYVLYVMIVLVYIKLKK